MSAPGIDAFAAAIRRLESGSYQGNYSAIGPATRTGDRARGAYQIMGANWSGWAKAAGIPGADWRSPAAQDRVARFMFERYYQKYRDWSLVAVAWFAGPGRADAAMKKGVGSLAGVADVTGTDVPKYVNLIRDYMAKAPGGGFSFQPGDFAAEESGNPPLAEGVEQPMPASPIRQSLTQMLDVFSRAIAGGDRQIPVSTQPSPGPSLTAPDVNLGDGLLPTPASVPDNVV